MADVINLTAERRAREQINMPVPRAVDLEYLWESYWQGLESDADNDDTEPSAG